MICATLTLAVILRKDNARLLGHRLSKFNVFSPCCCEIDAKRRPQAGIVRFHPIYFRP